MGRERLPALIRGLQGCGGGGGGQGVWDGTSFFNEGSAGVWRGWGVMDSISLVEN